MIRPADARDLEALYELETVCFADRRFRKEHLLHILKNPRATTFVYENGGVLGSLMVLDERTLTRVLSIGVHPRYRRRGIGRALMAVAEQVGTRFRTHEIRLEVSTKNPGAIAFYRRLGYEITERLPRSYSWGDDAYAMAKPIAHSVRNP